MTDDDRAELAQIEADARDVKLRRKRFFAKLRQRAFRASRKLRTKHESANSEDKSANSG